jgi:hypothetical protein
MIAPPLTFPRFEIEPKVISIIPMKMTAKAMKNSHVAIENPAVIEYLGTAPGFSFAWQSMHDQ